MGTTVGVGAAVGFDVAAGVGTGAGLGLGAGAGAGVGAGVGTAITGATIGAIMGASGVSRLPSPDELDPVTVVTAAPSAASEPLPLVPGDEEMIEKGDAAGVGVVVLAALVLASPLLVAVPLGLAGVTGSCDVQLRADVTDVIPTMDIPRHEDGACYSGARAGLDKNSAQRAINRACRAAGIQALLVLCAVCPNRTFFCSSLICTGAGWISRPLA